MSSDLVGHFELCNPVYKAPGGSLIAILTVIELGINLHVMLVFDRSVDTLTKMMHHHYYDVIMGAIASQITSPTTVYSTVYSDADQRKYQSSAPLAFVRAIHWEPVNSPHKWPVTRKILPFDDVIMSFHFVNITHFNPKSPFSTVQKIYQIWICVEIYFSLECQHFAAWWCDADATFAHKMLTRSKPTSAS